MKKTKSAGSDLKVLNRDKRFELRLTAQELADFILLEQQSGISRADIIRVRVLQNSAKVLVNAKELMQLLDSIGVELGRSSYNINILAVHANTLAERELLTANIGAEFNELLTAYVSIQQDIEKVLRQLIRLMKT